MKDDRGIWGRLPVARSVVSRSAAGAFLAFALLLTGHALAQAQRRYALMTIDEARRVVDRRLSGLDEGSRKFLGKLLPVDQIDGRPVVSGVRVNNTEYVVLAVTDVTLDISQHGEFIGKGYGVLISTIDLEVVDGGAKRVLKKDVYHWGVGPKMLHLKSMAEPGTEKIIYDQPIADFKFTIGGRHNPEFIPRLSPGVEGFVITVAGKQLRFR